MLSSENKEDYHVIYSVLFFSLHLFYKLFYCYGETEHLDSNETFYGRCACTVNRLQKLKLAIMNYMSVVQEEN